MRKVLGYGKKYKGLGSVFNGIGNILCYKVKISLITHNAICCTNNLLKVLYVFRY